MVLQEDNDLPYEEEILRNPYSVKSWLRYIEFKKDAPRNTVNLVYERALKELPGRYSESLVTNELGIWHCYFQVSSLWILLKV